MAQLVVFSGLAALCSEEAHCIKLGSVILFLLLLLVSRLSLGVYCTVLL